MQLCLLLAAVLCEGVSTHGSTASTHWMVTENGLIQPRDNSPFAMARPYDLIGFLNQDTMYKEIVDGYHDLNEWQERVSVQWETLQQATDLKVILDSDDDCNSAEHLNLLNLHPGVLDSIRRGEISETDFGLIGEVGNEQPECSQFSDLDFSMFTFEHLEGMRNRSHLSMRAEELLHATLAPPHLTLAAFGDLVHQQLSLNRTSWLHYALASVYWKARGDAGRAMECSRRAVYYAPRRFKDIALLSMGSIFMRGTRRNETHVVVSAALDHAPSHAVNHFALGNAHVLMGELNSSIACYERSLELDPNFEQATEMRQLMLCHRRLHGQLNRVQENLDALRTNLTEYSTRELRWWKLQSQLLGAMHTNAARYQDVTRASMEVMCQTLAQPFGLDLCSLKQSGDKNSLIETLLQTSLSHGHNAAPLMPLKSVMALHTFVHNVEKQMEQMQSLASKSEHLRARDGKIRSETTQHKIEKPSDTHEMADEEPLVLDSRQETEQEKKNEDKNSKDSKRSVNEFPEYEGGPVLYPPTYRVNRNREEFDTRDDWPSEELCAQWVPRLPVDPDRVRPVFLPFENKGLRLDGVLSEKIGLAPHEEHPLPWHPPVCRELKAASTLPKLPKTQQGGDSVGVERLRSILLRYVGEDSAAAARDLHEAEIGQRILTAYKKKVAPAWTLHTLASLYWRARRHHAHALACLASAGELVPQQYRDIVHTSLASVLLEVGYVEAALAFATQAFTLSPHEPATNFVLSLIHMSRDNRAAQMFHMRQVLRVEPGFMEGEARAVLHAWACRQRDETDGRHFYTETAVCSESLAGDAYKSCSSGGDTCTRATVSAFKHHAHELEDEISTIVRLLDLKTPRREMEEPDSSAERREVARKLRYIVLDNMLKSCGDDDCGKLHPVSASDVHTQTCFFQHLRASYWLPYLRLDTLLQERGIRLESLVRLEYSLPHTFPDCVAPPSSGDPAHEWLTHLHTDNWRPAPDLLTEVQTLLGKQERLEDISAMLAYHVSHGGTWLGSLLTALWCGGFGRGSCSMRCGAAALRAAPTRHKDLVLLSLLSVLHLQDLVKEAKQAAYFALPLAPKNKLHLFVAGISHTYVGEYSAAIRLFRLALAQDSEYAVARACLHATMCLVLYIDDIADAHK